MYGSFGTLMVSFKHISITDLVIPVWFDRLKMAIGTAVATEQVSPNNKILDGMFSPVPHVSTCQMSTVVI